MASGIQPPSTILRVFAMRSTVGASANYNNVRGTTQLTATGSEKVYFEFTWNALTDNSEEAVGIANRSAALDGSTTNFWLGFDTHSIGWFPDGGVNFNGVLAASIQTITTTQVGCVAIDRANQKIWFRTGSGNWNNAVIGSQNPATNTGGISFSGMGAVPLLPILGLAFSGENATFNFDGPFAQTVPSGFTKFDGTSATPAKGILFTRRPLRIWTRRF
jgi:hypothetical protein